MPSISAKWFENIYPTLLSLLSLLVGIGAWAMFPAWQQSFIIGAAKLFPSALNVGAISTGFLATSLSILLSLSGSRVFKKLREEDHDNRLIKFFSRALAVSFAWSLMSAWMTALNFGIGGTWRKVAFIPWCFLSLCAIFCYYRASRLLTAVLVAHTKTTQQKVPAARLDGEDGKELQILV
jgi:hypothetical protein